jgi:hypothetical protein
VSDFEKVSSRGQRHRILFWRSTETQTKHRDLASKNMLEPPICLFPRISNSLWHIQTRTRGRETHSGDCDKGRAWTSSHLQGLS